MGCVSSKKAVSVRPALDHSGNVGSGSGRSACGGGGWVVESEQQKKKLTKHKRGTELGLSGSEWAESGRGSDSASFRLGNLQKYIEGEQVAAGWPAWLSAVAGEAIRGWVPLRAEAFEKLEKVGQGTYSTVFKARDLESGKIVALKKVRFDNFEPESVRFMAREILILRRLHHPNVIALEGIITSQLSSTIYLVFEYMEHDLSGLLSCPDIKFSEAQVKCYMKQLFSGLEHCHSLGVMHRDIKGANLLVNNEGVVKIGDFGLANLCCFGQKQPLTSRVITLWYRPPELLLGSTDYGTSVDIWSVGCVFAELLLGVPILQGRTEVEQLHKIFKLCGSPPDDYWKTSRLPHATLFKPQHPYESCLRERFKELPKSAVSLIETLLAVEPDKRETASSALSSEYFMTKPFACDPSSLPKYPPNKEIDAVHREDAMRKRPVGRAHGPDTTRRLSRRQSGASRLAPEESLPVQTKATHKINRVDAENQKGSDTIVALELHKPSFRNLAEETTHAKNASQGDIPYSGPLQISGSSGFAWARRRIEDPTIRSRSRSSSRSLISEPSDALPSRNNFESKKQENIKTGHGNNELPKHASVKNWNQLERPDSFDGSDEFHSQELSLECYQQEEILLKRINLTQIYLDEEDKVEFSGPILSQSRRVDELLERHERQIRRAVRRSWFQRDAGKAHG